MTMQQSQADSQLPHRMPAAFIACNPEPMGLKERQVPYAADGDIIFPEPSESGDVASTSASTSAPNICVSCGGRASIHVCRNTQQGQCIMQHDQLDVDATDDWRNDRLSLFEGTAIETKHMKAEQADQVHIAAEIATLSISSGWLF
ncbi:unnamed protein product [Sphagnum troendelagicum]|uniref:Uncharacterized protein n=1 Tax=Sphagnum troendelagicum TaxID=128251 RepID=A0ABP0U3V2_9BRYO